MPLPTQRSRPTIRLAVTGWARLNNAAANASPQRWDGTPAPVPLKRVGPRITFGLQVRTL